MKSLNLSVVVLMRVLAGVCMSLTVHSSSAVPPNVVLILADDLGWADLGCYGSTYHPTPRLDAFARTALRLTQAYTPNPLCSPTRSSIMTGQHPARTGFTAPSGHLAEVRLTASVPASAPAARKVIMPDSVTRLATNHYTLAEAFHDSGYATGHFGKWHLGPSPFSPLEHGFEVDIPHYPGPGPAGSYVAPWKFPDIKPRTPDEHIEDRMADEAIAWMKEHRDRPFFLNYWMFSVHAPFDAKVSLIERYEPTADPARPQHCPTYAAMVHSLDENVGKVLDALDQLELADKTVVVFYSDNGGNMYNRVGGVVPTSNAPLRGGKGGLWEGGIRVPAIIRWPGVTPAGAVSDALFQSQDLYPTLLEVAGIPARPGQALDAVSQVPLLRDGRAVREEVFAFFPHSPPSVPDQLPPAASVRVGDWRLIRLFHDGADGADRNLLFNLGADIGEQNDLAAREPARVERLSGRLDRFLAETGAVLPRTNPAHR